MYGTPRLRSAFPNTPKTEPGSHDFRSSYDRTPSRSKRQSIIRPTSTVKPALFANGGSGGPPSSTFDFLDGPNQRLFALAFWILLQVWKLSNWYSADDSDLESTWLFMKWCSIELVGLVGISTFKIPWLEWSFTTVLSIWAIHVVLNFFLMFGITIPIGAWLGAMVKVAYDRELSLSDYHVKPADIIHNSSIILGKQIINLLPEGSAVFNPDDLHFCLDSTTTSVNLPIVINQTTPESIELERYDLDTEEVETITIGAKQARKLKAAADKAHEKNDLNTPRTLMYPVSKKGLYRLARVIDKSKLEVRRRNRDLAVVACPKAAISANVVDKCTGDLSGIALHVTGVPPFNVKYSKRVNNQRSSSISQTIQPSDDEPEEPSTIVSDPRRPHLGWTQSVTTSVEINESLGQNGTWMYTIEEVEDGLRNKVKFDTEPSRKLESAHHAQALTVHKRPQVKFHGCDAEHYQKVPKGDVIRMPLMVTPPNQIPQSDWPFKMRWTFTPESDDPVSSIEQFEHDLDDISRLPTIGKAGRYDLLHIESKFCQGEVNEPSSCLINNPPRPALSFQTEEIFDKCAGRPIGMLVNFDFTGSPPFKVRYDVTRQGQRTESKIKKFDSMRGQMEIRERDAGSYKYEIVEVEDDVYSAIPVRSVANSFQQDIRPPADAFLNEYEKVKRACLGQPISVNVGLHGEGPWELEYELVHSGKRKRFSAKSDQPILLLELPPQSEGGQYNLVLTSVQDASRCKTALKGEFKIEIRPEQPRAAWGDVEGRRSVEALEGKKVKIPLKLKGIPPWSVNIEHSTKGLFTQHFKDQNSVFQADEAGVYEIVSISDSCPGVVDPKANKFEVSWIKRPELFIKDSTARLEGNHYIKEPVCQGDADALRLSLTGHQPYHIKYSVKAQPAKGQNSVTNKPLSAATKDISVEMDTSKAGHYTYTFNELSDNRYAHESRHFSPLIVKQEVYAPPTAQFSSPGKTYGFCRDEPTSDADAEHIPITLTGVPPFSIDVAIAHNKVTNRPEIIRIKDILSTSYSWSLPRSSLPLGRHSLSIRAVRDSRNCESSMFDATNTKASQAAMVHIHVSSPPSIASTTSQTDFCVGDHVAYSLTGTPPFNVFYTFGGRERKAVEKSHEFRRITDTSGDMIVTGVSDSATSKCRAKTNIFKYIHPYPTVRLARGKTHTSDIHEGGEVDMYFDFTGTPPFEVVYTRSENVVKKGKAKGKPRVLERKTARTDEFSMVQRVGEEGTYEVISIKDRFCSYSAEGGYGGEGTQKMIEN